MAIPAAVISLATPNIVQAIKWLSPTIRRELEEIMKAWYGKALQSSGKLDDVGAKLLCTLLNVDVSGVVVAPGPLTQNLPGEVVDAIIEGVVHIAAGPQDPFTPPGNSLGGP